MQEPQYQAGYWSGEEVSQHVLSSELDVMMAAAGAAENKCGLRMLLPREGGAVSFALAFTFAAEHAAKRSGSAGPLDCGRRLEVNQVIVRLAHPRLLALVTASEEELGALLKEAACSKQKRRS